MSLFKITNQVTKSDQIAGPVPVEVDKVRTVLQTKGRRGVPTLVGYGVQFCGSAADHMLVEVVETDAPAKVTPIAAEQVIKVDAHAAQYGRPEMDFDLDDEGNGTGHSAIEEGEVTDIKLLDSVMLAPLQKHTVLVDMKQGYKLKEGSVVRVRCKPVGKDGVPTEEKASVGVVAYLMIQC